MIDQEKSYPTLLFAFSDSGYLWVKTEFPFARAIIITYSRITKKIFIKIYTKAFLFHNEHCHLELMSS